MPRPFTLRILGAGVSGLAAAHLLAADGHQVDLVDERFDVPTVGTALGLFGSAQRVLDRLGVLERVREVSATPRQGTLRTADGHVLATVPAGDALLVSRSALVQILHDALPDSVRRRRTRIEDVRPLRVGADLLIGADGVRSLVRRSGWPGRPRARSHGVTVLRGTTDQPPPEISETWGRGWLFGITPLPRQRTNWFAAVPEHRTASRSEDLAHLRDLVGGHRPVIDAVLDAATAEHTLVHGIHTAPPVLPVRERAVLLGDAAHAMAPNLGHGANTALQDAGALATALHRHPQSVGRALACFALRRTVPGQGWRVGSELMMRIAMAEEHAPLRDRALGAAGGLLARG